MKKIAVVALFLGLGISFYFLKQSFTPASTEKTTSAIDFSWEYTPKHITLSTPVDFNFYLKDLTGKNITDAKIEIEATMNHSGMVPIFTEAIYIKNATYSTRLTLTMLGEWILFLTITLPNGETIKKEVTFMTN